MLMVLGAVAWERRIGASVPFVLLLLGDASYSIYLTHYALLDLLMRGLLTVNAPALMGPLPAILIVLILTVAGGVLFYLVIESPLLARLRTAAPRHHDLRRTRIAM
jgi:peptidoglycan/LPS O-acetylase OafA/YrhL